MYSDSYRRKIARHSVIQRFILRFCDIVLSGFGLIVLSPGMLLILVTGWAKHGSPIFAQKRVGWREKEFTLIKFRTMALGVPSVASHKVSHDLITPFGHWLRKTKCDELPQLINVLRGEMSLVGPRPCLPNQTDVIEERRLHNCFCVRPGITGEAQIQKVDMSEPKKLAELDGNMIQAMCLRKYVFCLLKTVCGAGRGDAVKQHG